MTTPTKTILADQLNALGACAGAWRARRSDLGAHEDRTLARAGIGPWRAMLRRTHEIDETTDFDRLGKRADRRREFGRGNCGLAHFGLAHGNLLWILS